MKFKLQALLLLFLIAGKTAFSQAPIVTYAEPLRDEPRHTEFDVIGKLNGNYLIYRKNQNDHSLVIYDEDMKLKKMVRLDYNSDRWIDVDFIKYPDFVYMIYEYQRRSLVHCMGVKLDAEGQKIGEPFEMDTTEINFASNNKVYTVISSDDKRKIMVLKIDSKNKKNFFFTTMLYDDNLRLLHKDRMSMPMEEKNDYFSDFMLSNSGKFCFAKFTRTSSNSEYISKVVMVTKTPDATSFAVSPVDIGPRMLDELKLKVDNTNKRLLLNAFFYKERRGNIDGLYTLVWDDATNSKISDTVIVFNDELRDIAKSSDASKKAAFDDYYIKNITIRRDGGFLVVSEALSSTSRGNTFNRWDRWGNPWSDPMDYYSPYGSYYSPWGFGRYGYGNPYGYGYPYGYPNGYGANRYFANNIMILSLDKNGLLEWSNVIQKSQYDDQTDNMLSFQTMNTGSEIHFIYNQYEKRTMLLSEQSIDPNGQISKSGTLRNLDKGYDFMPRFGKQVSATQMIVPCIYRNSLCFAKIEW